MIWNNEKQLSESLALNAQFSLNLEQWANLFNRKLRFDAKLCISINLKTVFYLRINLKGSANTLAHTLRIIILNAQHIRLCLIKKKMCAQKPHVKIFIIQIIIKINDIANVWIYVLIKLYIEIHTIPAELRPRILTSAHKLCRIIQIDYCYYEICFYHFAQIADGERYFKATVCAAAVVRGTALRC